MALGGSAQHAAWMRSSPLKTMPDLVLSGRRHTAQSAMVQPPTPAVMEDVGLVTLMSNPASDAAHQDQDEQDDDDEPEPAARIVAPAAAVRPGGQRAQKHQYQDHEQDSDHCVSLRSSRGANDVPVPRGSRLGRELRQPRAPSGGIRRRAGGQHYLPRRPGHSAAARPSGLLAQGGPSWNPVSSIPCERSGIPTFTDTAPGPSASIAVVGAAPFTPTSAWDSRKRPRRSPLSPRSRRASTASALSAREASSFTAPATMVPGASAPIQVARPWAASGVAKVSKVATSRTAPPGSSATRL